MTAASEDLEVGAAFGSVVLGIPLVTYVTLVLCESIYIQIFRIDVTPLIGASFSGLVAGILAGYGARFFLRLLDTILDFPHVYRASTLRKKIIVGVAGTFLAVVVAWIFYIGLSQNFLPSITFRHPASYKPFNPPENLPPDIENFLRWSKSTENPIGDIVYIFFFRVIPLLAGLVIACYAGAYTLKLLPSNQKGSSS